MNKKQVITAEDVERYYSTCRKIKFKEFTPKDIKELFHAMTQGKETTFTKGGFQCFANRRRSLDDIFNISKFYFPELSIKEILKTIEEELDKVNMFLKENLYKYPYLGYCSMIRKSNFHLSAYPKTPETHSNHLKNASLYSSGFPNCHLKIKDLY